MKFLIIFKKKGFFDMFLINFCKHLTTNVIWKSSNQKPNPFTTLPMEIHKRIIHESFQNSKTNLPSMALVSKSWKALIDSKTFRETIHPVEAFGVKEWQKYCGDAGEEQPLPRRAYADLEKYRGLLTFIPKKINVINKKGETEEVFLDSLKAIGILLDNLKDGNKPGYDPATSKNIIEGKRELEEAHWSWISHEVIGKGETCAEHKAAEKENKKAPGAHISDLIDTATSIFMAYVRFKEINFKSDNEESTLVRVREYALPIDFKIRLRTKKEIEEEQWLLHLTFRPTDSKADLDVQPFHEDQELLDLGFAPAWKFFGS
jgi:hypothetical protein